MSVGATLPGHEAAALLSVRSLKVGDYLPSWNVLALD
jgi:hypothetical protein